MKRVLFFSSLLISTLLFGQTQQATVANEGTKNADEKVVKLYGFVRFDAYYDTYESTASRDELLYLYPKKAVFDVNGNDINKSSTLGMASFVSAFGIKVNGPEVWGAKTSSLLETDFYATADSYVQLLRLRHAYVKLDWGKFNLLIGQASHPMQVAKCMPSTVTYAIAVPFSVLNRSPQISATFLPVDGLSIQASALIHGYHKTPGDVNAQRNSGLPDMQLQGIYSVNNMFVGFTTGVKFLKPRLVTTLNNKTDKKISSYNLQGFAGYANKNISVKIMGILGENLTHLTMIGGYGAAQNPVLTDDYDYSNMRTYSYWTDITFLDNPKIGIFAGITGNMGATGKYYPISGYSRVDNMEHTYRLSPRVTYKIKNLDLGFEYLYAAAVYGKTFDEHYKAIDVFDATVNHRLVAMLKYTF